MKTDRTSMIIFTLALIATGCVDREAPAVGADDIGAGEGTDAGTPHVVAVSITESGMMMPSLQSGPTTFSIANDGAEDCILTMVPFESDGFEGDGATQRAYEQPTSAEHAPAGASSPSAGSTAGAEGSARSDARGDQRVGDQRDHAAAPPTTPASTSNRAAARRATTLTMDLQPGTYEVSCADASGQAQRTSRAPMFVVVTDEGAATSGAGGVSPPRGVTTPTDGMQGNDAERRGTSAARTPSGAPTGSDDVNR